MRLLVMALALKKQRLISSNIFVFLHFDISHADSLTDLIRLIEQVRSTPRKKRGIYWTKVSIDTLVLATSNLLTVDVNGESVSRAPNLLAFSRRPIPKYDGHFEP